MTVVGETSGGRDRALLSDDASASQFEVETRYGILIDTREPLWSLDAKNAPANIGLMRSLFDAQLQAGLDATLRSFAATKSNGFLRGVITAFVHLHASVYGGEPIATFDVALLRNYRRRLIAQYGHEDYLSRIRGFLRHWSALRGAGIEVPTLDALNAMRLKHKPKGRAVTTMDPEEGPFSHDELQRLTRDLFASAEAGKTSISDTSLMTFHIVTGRRPDQTSNLKCKDVDRSRRDESPAINSLAGRELPIIAVPRAKGKGEGFRESMRGVHAEEAFFALMEAQKGVAQTEFKRLLLESGLTLNDIDSEFLLQQLPLYPSWQAVSDSIASAFVVQSAGEFADSMHSLRVAAASPAWHQRAALITSRLKEISGALDAKSRSGTSLKVTAYRFRYSRGTDLARMGVGLEVIAWLLDHSTTKSARSYIANLAEHGRRINSALASSTALREISSAFTPELLDTMEDGDASEAQKSERIDFHGKRAAKCGIQKRCGMGLGIPFCCYTCNQFRPWVDGPHEEVLTVLLRQREEDVAVLGDDSPVAQRHDETIRAVIVVIHRCDARRQEMGQSEA